MSNTDTKTKSESASVNRGTAADEEVLRLDDAVYDDLKAVVSSARSRFGAAELFGVEKEKVEAFLFWEARLLDGKRYRDWADLLTTDFIYWIPASPDVVDARKQGSVNFDDRRRILDRIGLIETNIQWAQVPRSRTCRMLSNIEAFPGAGGRIHARSNVAIWEYRMHKAQCFVGWQEHELVPASGEFHIRRKIIGLLDCDQPQGNTTFIL